MKGESMDSEEKCFRCKHERGEHDEGGCRGGEDIRCWCDSFDEPVSPEFVCGCGDGDPICLKEKAQMAQIEANSAAYERLKAKSKWEGMTLYGVLREWGDPRQWPNP